MHSSGEIAVIKKKWLMSADLSSQLIIVTTYDCNLRCSYCPVGKKKTDIKAEFARKAIRLFLNLNKQNKKPLSVKFFGGEPMLHPELLDGLISRLKRSAKKNAISYAVTTNGTLLEDPVVKAFLKKHRDLKLFISIDGPFGATSRNRKGISRRVFERVLKKSSCLEARPTVNMVIAPDQARNFHKNYVFLRKAGFRKFNFLPAYFVKWSATQERDLRRGFEKIARTYKKSGAVSGELPHNAGVVSRIPFFNEALVVDCNGDIYFNNIFLSGAAKKWAGMFKAGNVAKMNVRELKKAIERYRDMDVLGILKERTGKEIFSSTMEVDAELGKFIRDISL